MKTSPIIESLKTEKQNLLSQFGVEEIGVFGSYARGEESVDSYVDILVTLKIKTLRNYIALIDFLQNKRVAKIDVKTNESSAPYMKYISKLKGSYKKIP